MRRLSPLVLSLLVASCMDAPESITAPNAGAPALARVTAQVPAFQPGVVVARFVAGADPAEVASIHGAAPRRALRLGMHVLSVPEGREQAIVQALSGDSRVLFAELSVPRTLGIPCAAADGDCAVPGDVLLGRRWDLHNDGTVKDAAGNVLWSTGLVPDADMDWLEAFDQLGQFTGSAVLGVIDTGIFGAHEDLAGRLVAQHDHFNIDAVAEDDNGHGTHVSGIGLAYADNAKGAAGVAYGPDIRLVVSKVCGFAAFLGYICWSPDVADGIAWAVDNGANVLNLSLGGNEGSAAEQTSLQYALSRGVLPVCAAGNDKAAVDYPAAFPECMAVSATGWDDRRASYSSAGPEVEVAAPGGDTLAAQPYDMIASTWNDGGYVYSAGTSMASPQVAGLAVLLHALGVTGAAEKRSLLRATADDLGAAGFDWLYGDGRVNVWTAVQAAIGSPPPPPPPPENQAPVAGFTSSCADLTCTFTDASSDADGTVAAWSWTFGDGNGSSAQGPTHAYAAAGMYQVVLTVTDDGGLTDQAIDTVSVGEPAPPPPANLTLSANGSKDKGEHVVDLVWGGTSLPVDVYRDGALVATVPSTLPTYQDRPGTRGKATYVYRVCEAGTATCSNEATVVF